MRVDVETRGEFTRGETVKANLIWLGREQRSAPAITAEIESVVELKPNARVCLASGADRCVELFIARLKGK